jgi:hypothetical protein
MGVNRTKGLKPSEQWNCSCVREKQIKLIWKFRKCENKQQKQTQAWSSQQKNNQRRLVVKSSDLLVSIVSQSEFVRKESERKEERRERWFRESAGVLNCSWSFNKIVPGIKSSLSWLASFIRLYFLLPSTVSALRNIDFMESDFLSIVIRSWRFPFIDKCVAVRRET